MTRKKLASLLWILLILLVTTTLDLPGNSRLLTSLQNAGHALAFGLIALALLSYLSATFPQLQRSPTKVCLVAFGLSVIAGALTELIQLAIGRDAELPDLVRDVLGASSFLAFYYTIDSHRIDRAMTAAGRFIVRLLAVMAFLATLVSFGMTSLAYLHRNHAFPEISDFSACWSGVFIDLQDAVMSRVDPPPGWPLPVRAQVSRLTLRAAEYPGMTIEEPFPDWRKHGVLCFSLFLESPATIDLGLRIDDSHHDFAAGDRFNRRVTLTAGPNEIRIPLIEVEHGPTSRRLDMSSIARIILFAHEPLDSISLLLDRCWLE